MLMMEVESPVSWISDRDGVDYNVFYGNMESIIFHNETHSSRVLHQMKVMYDDAILTDVILSIDGHKLPCHRFVLAAFSPYFKAMFTLDLTECRQDEIDLFEVDYESVSQLVTYAYTGSIGICRQNVQNLLAAASLFQIMPVHKACAKFLETQLDCNNCLGIHSFAKIHSCDILVAKAWEHIERNITEVCKGDEFLSLPLDKVVQIISSDELNVDREEIVYDAVIAWVSAKGKERKPFLKELFPLVRLGLLSLRCMQDRVMKNRLVLEDVFCENIIQNFKEYESNPHRYHGENHFSLSLRSGMIKPEHCILLLGGVDNHRPFINCYNPLTRESFVMEDFPNARNFGDFDVENAASTITEKGIVFAGGGNYIYHSDSLEHFDSDDSFDDLEECEISKDFYRYDDDHNKWQAIAPMLFPKSNFTLAALGGKIYCFGGVTENQHPTEIIEVYDMEKNRWSYQGMLPTSLVDLSSVVHDDYIFLLGGRTGVGAHNLVFMYHPNKGHWISRAGMQTPRFNFGSCVVDGEIYVVGGQIYSHSTNTISRQSLKCVEIFSISNNQWRGGPNLPESMHNVGLHVINGSLHACGTAESAQGSRLLHPNMVCRLDMGQNRWEVIEKKLCETRNFSCLAAKLHTRRLSQVFRPDVDT